LKKAEEEFEKVKEQAKEKYPEAVEKVKAAVAKAEEAMKQKLAEAEKEYNKVKDEVKQDLQKIADDLKHAIGKREAKQDAEQVAKDVQAQVDNFMPALFMFTSVAVSELPRKVEERATAAKKELDALKNGDVSKIEELNNKVKLTYGAAQKDINEAVATVKSAMQKGESMVVSEIDILKDHATKTYGDLKDKVIKALDDTQQELNRILKLAENQMAQAGESTTNTLRMAEVEYESSKKTWSKTPTHEQFGVSVKLLENGLDKAVEAVKQSVDQVRAAWEKEDLKKSINDNIKRTITGHSA